MRVGFPISFFIGLVNIVAFSKEKNYIYLIANVFLETIKNISGGKGGIRFVKVKCEYSLYGKESGSQTNIGWLWIGGEGVIAFIFLDVVINK